MSNKSKKYSPQMRFSSFTRWLKSAILRRPKLDNTTINERQVKRSPSINERPVKRSPSTRKTPSKRPYTSAKRRRSRKLNRRSGSGGSRSGSGSRSSSNSNSTPTPTPTLTLNLNLTSTPNSYFNSDLCENNKNENFIIINNEDVDNYSDDNNDNNDNNNDDDDNNNNMIIPNVNSDMLFEMKSDTCEISSSVMSRPESPSSDSSSDDDDDDDDDDDNNSRIVYLENTRIIKGSVEHFAYVRTLRKLRKDRQRSMNQAVLLNNILKRISVPSQLSDEIRKELIHFKSRIYEINRRLKRTSVLSVNDINGGSLFNNSISSLCPSSSMNKRLSAIIAEVRPISPITMKYRPSYASSKVVTVFDEVTNQLVVKDLPVARRKRRLSDLSNILIRSASSSSTTSTNSSQSSLVTLTDDAEQLKFSSLTKEPESYISNHIIIREEEDDDDDDDDDDEKGCHEDDVPLFVLKEQFRYSGRGYGFIKNNLPSLEGYGPPCVTLTV